MSTSESNIHGSCLCGNVTYTVDSTYQGAPSYEGAAICHCDHCRKSTGSAYSIVITVPRPTVHLKGSYKEYLTDGMSGKTAHRIFCPNCGSQVANFPDGNKEIVFIKAGTLADEIQKTLEPNIEVFTRSRLPYHTARYGEQHEIGPL